MNNVTNTVDYIDVSPIAGEIIIQVETSDGTKGTINVIELIEKP